MSNITKLILILIFICIIVSGCKKSPTDINDTQASSWTPMPPEQLWANYGASDENNFSIDENDTHVTAEITANCVIDPLKTRTIRYDLDIPQMPDFTAYEYKFSKGGEFNLENIMPVFYGEEYVKNIKPFENDPGWYGESGIDSSSIAGYNKANAELYLTKGNAQSWNVFEENKLNSVDEIDMDISENDAIALCDKFLSDCGITGYKYDYTEYFGAKAESFYDIRFYRELNNWCSASWVNNEKGFCYLTFFVNSDGIMLVKGSLFDENSFTRGEKIDKTQIISPQKALKYISEQAAVIRCGNNNPYFNKYYAEGEGLVFLPIREMKLGYWFSQYDGIKLAWIFYIGENDANEKNASFAIDATTGKAYNNI